jgi:hypothetical protein
MRRDKSHSCWGVSAALLLGLGLLLWLTPPLPDAVGEFFDEPCVSAVTGPPSARHAPPAAPPRPEEKPRARTASEEASSPPSWSTAPPPPSDDVFARASPSASPQASLLPTAAKDISSDGLPAAATHCRWEGAVFKCGSCQSSEDCPQDQGCLINRETRRLECMASECEEDAHCFPGTTCREIKTGTSNAVIRRCTPVGERNEGESCDPDYISRSGACREGLRCLNQVCTQPCQLSEPTSCPKGHTCTDDPDGPGCVPDCDQLGCPSGQQCKHLPGGGNRCLARVTGTCPETPCAEGERCLMDGGRSRGSFWCARVCEPLHPGSCAPGELCGWAGGTASACFRQCDPKRIDSCGEGWMCATISEDLSLWGCRPSAFD